MAIVVRFFQEGIFKPIQSLIRLEVVAKVLNGDELSQRLISCLEVEYNLGPRVIIGGMRDGAFVNGATMRNVKFFYADYFDVVCFSHIRKCGISLQISSFGFLCTVLDRLVLPQL